MKTTVNLIGAGRVGRTLLRLLAAQSDVTVQHVASASRSSADAAVREAGAGQAVNALSDMAPADVWFLTVPDTEIAGVAAKLAKDVENKHKKATPQVAVHCSGYHVASIMDPLRIMGWHLASAHPMLSFADPGVAAGLFPGTLVGTEGDASAVEKIDRLFKALGARPFPIASEGKALYHAAGVFTNNFTTVLQAVALEAWRSAGVPEDVARDLNRTLLRSTIDNVERFGPAQALTGPAARGDRAVIEEQGRKVGAWHPAAGRLYAELSAMAARLKATGETGEEA